MPVRGWRAGRPVVFTSWQDLSTRSSPSGIGSALLVASGDSAAPLAAELIRAFEGYRVKPIGQAIAPGRSGHWRVYLAQQTLTLAYGPQHYFSLPLPMEPDKALAQVQDLLALAARQNPANAGGIEAFFDGPAEVTGAVQRMLTAIAAPVRPLRLGGGFVAAWHAIPIALRAGFLALALVLALHGLVSLSQGDLKSFDVRDIESAPPTLTTQLGASLSAGASRPAQVSQTGLGLWLKALAEALDQSQLGIPALMLLEIERAQPDALPSSRLDEGVLRFRVRLQPVTVTSTRTNEVRQLGGQPKPATKNLLEVLSGLPHLVDKPQQDANGMITMTYSGSLGPLGPDSALTGRQQIPVAQAATAMANQAKVMGLAIQIPLETAQGLHFLLTDQPALQVFGWLWEYPLAPSGWALNSLRIVRGSQPGLVTVHGRITP